MNINIGMKIREFHLRDSRMQSEFADALGISSQAVGRLETGVSHS